MAAPRAPAAIPPQSNWLTEWATRTPIVTRCALYSILPVSIVSFIWPQVSAVLVLNLSAVTGFQLWRFFTMLLIQGSFFILLFAIFHLVVKSPLDELQAGSLRYLARVVGYSLLIGVLWAAISTPMYLFAPGTASQVFGEPVTMGLFPFIFAQITMTALADPTGSQNLLGCIKIPNRAYPWVMLAVVCLLYFSIRLDLLVRRGGEEVEAGMAVTLPFPRAAGRPRRSRGLSRSSAPPRPLGRVGRGSRCVVPPLPR